jgi:hypothetical protein
MTTLHSLVFKVLDEPYCVWEEDVLGTNRRFLRGLDPDYFAYLTHIHCAATDRKHASVALRISSHHGLETLFSLVGAFLQAPDCVYAWVGKCSTGALRDLVRRVTAKDSTLFRKLKVDEVSWNSVATAVFRTLEPGTEIQRAAIQQFTALWQGLAAEFSESLHIEEYNSLKHGFRVGNGGFALSIGPAAEGGEFPPDNEFQLVGRSDFGTSFVLIKPTTNNKGDRALKVSTVHVNWSFERLVRLNEAIFWSLKNITTALRAANGVDPGTPAFIVPGTTDHFDGVWRNDSGLLNMRQDSIVPAEDRFARTKSQLQRMIDAAPSDSSEIG